MAKSLDYERLANSYCDLFAELGSYLASRPNNTVRGLDYYSLPDLRAAVTQSLNVFVAGNRYLPSIQSPKTFNEKIFVSKFLAPFPLPSLADKLLINSVACEEFGPSFGADVLWSSDGIVELEQTILELPGGVYFLKANHASGANFRMNLMVADRSEIVQAAKARAERWLSDNFGWAWGEFFYSTFKRKIFIERAYSVNDVRDYRFYCFGHEVLLIQVDQNSYSEKDHCRDFFDPDWKQIDISQGFPSSEAPLIKPADLPKMIEISRCLSVRSGMSFVRVDLFWDQSFGVRVAEVTYTPTNAYRAFSPAAWNDTIGGWWDLRSIVGY